MLGKDYYKVETNLELSDERLKSLIFFYGPLIGNDALATYLNLAYRENSLSFNELNELLSFLNVSVSDFENRIDILNKYQLVKSLNQDNKYIFVVLSPLNRKQFISNDLFVRDFILKTSGNHYQKLISDITAQDTHKGFTDISSTLSLDILDNWTKENESYLQTKNDSTFTFNTLFDVNRFLKDISTNLLPMRFRTKENLLQISEAYAPVSPHGSYICPAPCHKPY